MALALTGAIALSGCASKRVVSTEDWLADQPFVLGVEIAEAEHAEWGYAQVMRAELDPLATADDIEQLIADTVEHIDDAPADEAPNGDVGLHFGMLGLDFEVTNRAETKLAFELWRDIDDVPDVDRAVAFSDFITAHTSRETLVTVFDELAGLGVGARVDGDQADAASPVALVLPRECEPPAGARELASAEVANAAVGFATYDLCEGFDVVYVSGTVFDAAISGLLGSVDAAGLGEFPVRLSVAPQVEGSEDFHIVEATPGARDAFGVVTALDASGIAMRYELFAPRSADIERELTIRTTDATLEQLHDLLAASPASAFLGKLTITASDGEFEGHLEGLAEELAPAPTRTPTPTPSP
jgi:hypothetical protein